jgi:dipeptidyl aminopeptidase/acylaminoacyl peptidase
MIISRTIFKREIVSEFILPTRKSDKVLIICKGIPGSPGGRDVLEFYAKKGFNVFLPRYRGAWESGGKFLKVSPEKDILDIIGSLSKSFEDIWNNKQVKINAKNIYVFGASFGGPAALLLSKDERVSKVVAAAPVIDWTKDSKIEPLDWLEKVVNKGFGGAYRFSHKDWQKLIKGDFYSPWKEKENIPGEKVLIFHAKDDKLVPFEPAEKFAKITGAKLVSHKRGGHYGVVSFIDPKFYRHIKKFLAQK